MLTLEEKRDLIAEKLQLLYDFRILSKRNRKKKSAVVSVLAGCKTEVEMEQKLHNVLHGTETLDDLIDRHYMLSLR